MKLDLNCDLGEGEPIARTRALMRWISSANVACGGHAGTIRSMAACVRLAKQFGVRLGAHPGPWSRGDFGRGAFQMSPDELELLLIQQVGALERILQMEGVRLHHIKLHGSLYHASEAERALGHRYVATVARGWPHAKIYARAGGNVANRARRAGVAVWEEAFADRVYADDGTLAPRTHPGALLTDCRQIIRRIRELLERGRIRARSGRWLRLKAQTLCVHSDTPRAIEIVRDVSRLLQGEAKFDSDQYRPAETE